MNNDKLQMGIIGCGDFFTRRLGMLQNSSRVQVKKLFSPTNPAHAAAYAGQLSAQAVADAQEIFGDPGIDIVCLFTPPWVRADYVEAAAAAGKHIITTKPLCATVADGQRMQRAIGQAGVRLGVIYGRTGNALTQGYKQLFDSGEIGRLALYKQDWLHHYPTWNTWATDPDKNGGPFMDAMLHNLNTVRYLMGRPTMGCTFFADNLAQHLPCRDTESMKLDFAGGTAYLFITWAADLAVYSDAGNDREHIDIRYMVTDQGWRLTDGQRDGRPVIVASRGGQTREFPAIGFEQNPFDHFAACLLQGAPLPADIPGLDEALEDIRLIRTGMAQPGVAFV
nr:Gfo/Idh/MocA family oxidoreductase [bacterium]